MALFLLKISSTNYLITVKATYYIPRATIILTLLLLAPLSYGQIVPIKTKVSDSVSVNCAIEKKNNRYYQTRIGETYHRTVPANGWFRFEGKCLDEIYELPILECKLSETEIGTYYKCKNGRPFSGKIKDKMDNHQLIGRCKKGFLDGTVKVLDNEGKTIWQGEFVMGEFQRK